MPEPMHQVAGEPTNHQPPIINRVFETLVQQRFNFSWVPENQRLHVDWARTMSPSHCTGSSQTEAKLLPRNRHNTLASQGLHRIVQQVSKQLIGDLPEDHNLLLVCPSPRLLGPLVVGFEESVDYGAVRLGTVDGLTRGFDGSGIRVRGGEMWRDSRAAIRTRRRTKA